MALSPGQRAAFAASLAKQKTAPVSLKAKRLPHKTDLRTYRRDHQGRFRDAKEF